MARTPELDFGDEVEYGMSVFARHGKAEAWLSMKGRGTIREDESGAHAARRIERFVEARISEKVAEFMGEDV